MRFALRMKGGINSMKRIKYLYAAVLTASVLLMCSCSNQNCTDVAESNRTVDNITGGTALYVYDEDYDTNIVGTFSIEDYSDYIEDMSALLQDKRAWLSDELLKAVYKNYGPFESADDVKYATIEVFDKCCQFDTVSVATIKVYRDEASKTWLAMNKSMEELNDLYNGIFKLDGCNCVVFTDDGTILYYGWDYVWPK